VNPDSTRKPKIFYGWYIVAASFVSLWIHAGVGFYSFPIFLTEFNEYFGWGRGATNAGMSIMFIMGALSSPVVGRLLPQYGAKKIVMTGALIMSITFVLFSRMQTLWQFYIVCLGFAVGVSCTGPVPTSFAVSDWFQKKRGRATGIMMVGVGVGGLIIVPLTRWLINLFQWQNTFLLYAGVTSLLLIPIGGAIFRRRPSERGILPDGELSTSPASGSDVSSSDTSAGDFAGWPFGEAARTPTFWIIACAFILATFGQTGLLLNQVSYFQDIGISPEKAAGALGFCAMLGILGKLFFGVMADRYPVRYSMVLCFGLQAVGTLLLLWTREFGSPLWFVLVWGFAMGGIIALEPLIVGECFGMKSFGVILGMIYVCTTIGASSGPPFAGFISDMTNSYTIAFVVFIITYALAAGLSFLAIPPVPLSQKKA